MTREALQQAIRDATPVRPTELPLVEVYIAAAAAAFGIRPAAVISGGRSPRFLNARHIAIALIYADTGMSLSAIGDEFNLDHTTVLNAVRRVTTSPQLAAYAAAVRADMEGDDDGD